MIKIERPEDLRIFEGKPEVNPLVVRYLTGYLHFLLKEYHCSDLTEFGACFLLENRQDSLCHADMGLSLPLETSEREEKSLISTPKTFSSMSAKKWAVFSLSVESSKP